MRLHSNHFESLQHVADIRSARWAGEDGGLELCGGDVMANRKAEEVDYFIDMGSNEMRAEDLVGIGIDKHLEPIHRFGQAARGEPNRCLLSFHVHVAALLARGRLTRSDWGNGPNGKSGAWHAAVVRLVSVAFEEVRSHHFR